jgi:hypothetical protein
MPPLLATLPERPAVIVVDNGSTDGTPNRVRSATPSATVLEAARNLGGAAHNAGVAHASPLPRPDGVPGPCLAGFVACAAAVRREAFLEAGGFDQRLGVVAHHHPSKVRSRTVRRSNLTRNALWSVWLRRPALRALEASCRLGWAALRDPPERRGLAAAVAGAGWVTRQRRVVGPEVEAQLSLLS